MIGQFIDVFLHLDQHLNTWAGALGPWLYVLLFAIVFCETGLVVTPFLPGDSLLFAVGALATTPGSPIHVVTVSLLLIVAAILGDATNYAIGRRVGPRVFSRESSWLLNKQHLIRTQHFYEHHGGKTIFLARFMPIVRTFAPFVAGIGRMEYRRFGAYNVAGGITWVLLFIGAGYLFADLPIVKDRFHYVILGIIGVSVLPIVFEFARAQIAARRQRRLPENDEA
ncbi:MAG: DedA family protein [Ardenticatenales bacterium]|nr:DedA family protein [Ardenticatenales bacterium]